VLDPMLVFCDIWYEMAASAHCWPVTANGSLGVNRTQVSRDRVELVPAGS